MQGDMQNLEAVTLQRIDPYATLPHPSISRVISVTHGVHNGVTYCRG